MKFESPSIGVKIQRKMPFGSLLRFDLNATSIRRIKMIDRLLRSHRVFDGARRSAALRSVPYREQRIRMVYHPSVSQEHPGERERFALFERKDILFFGDDDIFIDEE